MDFCCELADPEKEAQSDEAKPEPGLLPKCGKVMKVRVRTKLKDGWRQQCLGAAALIFMVGIA
jgi:hypothetical protein